jgi:hypothetical protein
MRALLASRQRRSTALSSLVKGSTNLARPSASRSSVTFFKEMPDFSRSSRTSIALVTSSSRLGRSLPWSRKALNVSGGTVLTVRGPISSST